MNKKSGFYKNGKSHAEGGIPVLVDDNTPIEVEQFEYKLCNNAMNSTKIFEFKDKTNKEILDEIFRYSDCEFEQHKANSGDFIICKLAVMDKKKRNITGTAKEIINVMQSEKSCNVSNDSKEFKDGGSVNNTNLLAPNGKPSNLNEIQYHLVRTPEFKAWFGDWENNPINSSKVVDENGEPLVVYHGTYVENPFYIFDFNKADIGFHFGTLEQAKNRSETKLFFKNHKSIINPFFLNIRNLFSVTDIGDWEYPQRYIDMFISDNLISEIDAKKLGFFRAYEREDNKQIREYLIKKYINIGFEYSNKYEGNGNSYIVLEPNQIKLADGTNTTFDANNPDIRYAKGGEINDETYTKWKNLVNMSKSELENFYNSKDGKEAGLSSSEASKQGISSGRESARWIIKMKDTPKSEWTPTMWKWAKKQISFISRMSGMKGGLYDDKGNKTRKHTSLLIWGHNPKKYKNGGELSINNEITVFDETKYDDNGKYCYWKTYRFNDSSISIDYCLGDFFKIDSIATKEKSRRGGDASKLIDYAKEIALQNNFQKIDVYLPIDENTPRKEYTLEDYKKAVSFYKKNGFEFYTNSTVKMFCDLNKILKNGGELKKNEMENKSIDNLTIKYKGIIYYVADSYSIKFNQKSTLLVDYSDDTIVNENGKTEFKEPKYYSYGYLKSGYTLGAKRGWVLKLPKKGMSMEMTYHSQKSEQVNDLYWVFEGIVFPFPESAIINAKPLNNKKLDFLNEYGFGNKLIGVGKKDYWTFDHNYAAIDMNYDTSIQKSNKYYIVYFGDNNDGLYERGLITHCLPNAYLYARQYDSQQAYLLTIENDKVINEDDIYPYSESTDLQYVATEWLNEYYNVESEKDKTNEMENKENKIGNIFEFNSKVFNLILKPISEKYKFNIIKKEGKSNKEPYYELVSNNNSEIKRSGFINSYFQKNKNIDTYSITGNLFIEFIDNNDLHERIPIYYEFIDNNVDFNNAYSEIDKQFNEYQKTYLSLKENIKIESENKENLQDGKADKLTIEDIAKKHNVSVKYAKEQLNKGMKIESEHTSDTEKQKEIALDHLSEFIEYYNELDKMEEKLKQEEQDKTDKVYNDIKSCLIVEGDDENSYIFEGKEFINSESGHNEKWKFVNFFKYGTIVEHIAKNKLTTKKESIKLTFDELRLMYKDGDISIDGIKDYNSLNNCLKLLTKCIDIIDANEATKSEIEKHNLSKQEIEKLKNKISEIEQKSKKEVEKIVEPIEIIEPKPEIKEQSNEQKELKEAINTFEELIKLGGTDAEMKEWQEAVETLKMLL